MSDKHDLKAQYRKIMPNWTESELDDYVNLMEEKNRTVKKGENVIHLDYYGGLLTDSEIEEISSILNRSNLELSRYDKSGIMFAAVDDFILQVAIFLNDKTTQDILIGVGSGALWDTIKHVSLYIWKKVHNKFLNKVSAHKVSKQKLNFGIKLVLDKNTKFEFKISGNISEELALKSMDNILNFLRDVKPNVSNRPPDFVVYNSTKDKWEILNILEEIRKKEEKKKK
jgi:hypothetical protein